MVNLTENAISCRWQPVFITNANFVARHFLHKMKINRISLRVEVTFFFRRPHLFNCKLLSDVALELMEWGLMPWIRIKRVPHEKRKPFQNKPFLLGNFYALECKTLLPEVMKMFKILQRPFRPPRDRMLKATSGASCWRNFSAFIPNAVLSENISIALGVYKRFPWKLRSYFYPQALFTVRCIG